MTAELSISQVFSIRESVRVPKMFKVKNEYNLKLHLKWP